MKLRIPTFPIWTIAVLLLIVIIAINPDRNKGADLPKDGIVQPDYDAFQKVARGMDESEVVDLLGEPLDKPDHFDRNTEVVYSWVYGSITPKSLPFPKPPSFRVLFLKGKVFSSEDPFKGQFSKDGKPLTPTPLWPSEPPVYKYYPRYIDLRWSASSGVYPMTYEIEVQAFTGGDPDDVQTGEHSSLKAIFRTSLTSSLETSEDAGACGA